MDKNFDFNMVGKQMPYTTPDDFFNQMEKTVMDSVKQEYADNTSRPMKHLRVFSLRNVILTMAAAIAACFMIHLGWQQLQPEDSLEEVDRAFAKLSTADQNYLMEIYEDDVFLDNDDMDATE